MRTISRAVVGAVAWRASSMSHVTRIIATPARGVCISSGLFAPTLPMRCTAQTPSSSSTMDAATSALDVAMRVNKMKRLHQTGGSMNTSKKQIEYSAWKELNTLSEDQINNAEGKAVALLLNSWAYFAKFWEKGKDGPHGSHVGNEETQQKQ